MIKQIELIETRSKTRKRIWPNHQLDEDTKFYENEEYLVEVTYSRATNNTALCIDDSELLALRSNQNNVDLWQWKVGFIAGSIDFELFENTKTIFCKKLILSPSKSKLTYTEFEVMLSQILQESTELFSLGESRISISEGVDYSTPLTKLEYLRVNFNSILLCVNEIIDNPISYLRSNIEYQELSKFTGAVDPTRITEAHSIYGTVKVNQKLLPAKLPVKICNSELDIYEHRCIKHCLSVWASWLLFTAKQIKKRTKKKRGEETLLKWAKRAFKLSSSFEQLVQNDFFRDINTFDSLLIEPTHIFSSTPQYRKFFEIQKKVNLGIGNSLGDYLQMPLARTYKLYEIWCYYRVISAMKFLGYGVRKFSIKENTSPLNKGSIILSATFDDFSLHFQRNYDEYWKSDDGIGSYSRTMIPDISLQVPSSDDSIIIFDAKYRVETSLNEAISSSHMYRDAIVCEDNDEITRKVVGAYLLSPSIPSDSAGNWMDESSPKVFFHPAYVKKFQFGIMSLNPSSSIEKVAEVLKRILSSLPS